MVNKQWHKLTWSKAPGELTIEDLQDGCCGSHRGYRNKMFLAIHNIHIAPTPPTKFWLNLTYHSGADEVGRFSRWPLWWHLRYGTGTTLAILNLYVALMPPIKLEHNPHYGLRGDIIWRISR